MANLLIILELVVGTRTSSGLLLAAIEKECAVVDQRKLILLLVSMRSVKCGGSLQRKNILKLQRKVNLISGWRGILKMDLYRHCRLGPALLANCVVIVEICHPLSDSAEVPVRQLLTDMDLVPADRIEVSKKYIQTSPNRVDQNSYSQVPIPASLASITHLISISLPQKIKSRGTKPPMVPPNQKSQTRF